MRRVLVGSGEPRSAVGRQLSLVLLQAFRHSPFPGLHVLAERLRVGATCAHRLAQRTMLLGHPTEELAALGRNLVLVLLHALAGLHARAELLRIVEAGMLRCLGEQDREQQRHGSTFASERMLSVIEGSCGTDAISRLSASPMPGRCAPASSLGGAASS